jgi:hypothetical protein
MADTRSWISWIDDGAINKPTQQVGSSEYIYNMGFFSIRHRAELDKEILEIVEEDK